MPGHWPPPPGLLCIPLHPGAAWWPPVPHIASQGTCLGRRLQHFSHQLCSLHCVPLTGPSASSGQGWTTGACSSSLRVLSGLQGAGPVCASCGHTHWKRGAVCGQQPRGREPPPLPHILGTTSATFLALDVARHCPRGPRPAGRAWCWAGGAWLGILAMGTLWGGKGRELMFRHVLIFVFGAFVYHTV